MSDSCFLTNLHIGEFARINNITASGTIRRRLQDIGCINDTIVECVLKSPGGDPIAFKIRGAVIALRNEDSNQISVTLL